jgi:hypothetical protein
MSEWLLFDVKWAIFQQYHVEDKLYFDEMLNHDDDDIHFALN